MNNQEKIYRELKRVAASHAVITYSELVAAAGVAVLPVAVGPILDEINAKEQAAGRPRLADIVVSKKTMIAGYGPTDIEWCKTIKAVWKKWFGWKG